MTRVHLVSSWVAPFLTVDSGAGGSWSPCYRGRSKGTAQTLWRLAIWLAPPIACGLQSLWAPLKSSGRLGGQGGVRSLKVQMQTAGRHRSSDAHCRSYQGIAIHHHHVLDIPILNAFLGSFDCPSIYFPRLGQGQELLSSERALGRNSTTRAATIARRQEYLHRSRGNNNRDPFPLV